MAAVPVPILGTMTFGVEGQVKPPVAAEQLRFFCEAACAAAPDGCQVDTARMYQLSTPDGDTETVLGQILASDPVVRAKACLHTKAQPLMPPHFSLSKESVMHQCNTSLQKLGVPCVQLFYLHQPDVKTNIEDTLDGIQELHKQGKFKEFGLSNFPAWAVVDIWYRCKSRQMVLPTVYQGIYNVITRTMESEIVPVAREFGIRLCMFNPMGGGLLSGRYSKIQDLADATEGRFSAEFDPAFGPNLKAGQLYKARYSKEPIFQALTILGAACDEAGIPMAQAALRWLVHHSMLTAGDGVIIGVSKPEHLRTNLLAWQDGPLPAKVVEACEQAWQVARPSCESYFRGYGASPGGIETFLAIKAQQKKQKEEMDTEAQA